jgi:hypothetical protein
MNNDIFQNKAVRPKDDPGFHGFSAGRGLVEDLL